MEFSKDNEQNRIRINVRLYVSLRRCLWFSMFRFSKLAECVLIFLTVYNVNLENSVSDHLKIPDIFLHSHHLSALHCIDIVRIWSLLGVKVLKS